MKTWICDIDGTVAIMGDRGPFDWSRVGEDKPNEPVVRIVQALMLSGDWIVFMSGRMEQSRQQTELWLDANISMPLSFINLRGWDDPFMRADDDYRPDAVVKRELYETHVLGNYDIVGVIDDRGSVVRMWRELGLTCLQVADGDF